MSRWADVAAVYRGDCWGFCGDGCVAKFKEVLNPIIEAEIERVMKELPGRN